MRRFGAALTVVGALVALAGCAGLPPGVDGNLTDNWPVMPEAKVGVPAAGACYTAPYSRVWIGDFNTVDCTTGTHTLETAFVGTFTGADAERSAPPRSDSPAMPALYAECQKGANDYLGGDWHAAYVSLQPVLPSDAAWGGGARWFRCDLIHYSDPYANAVVDHGALKGDLAGARTAAAGCVTTTEDKDKRVLTAIPIDCASPHQAEFAGLFTAPDVPYPTDKTARDRMVHDGCEGVVATFLGFQSISQWVNQSVGWWPLGWSQEQWKLGDRTTQCYAYAYTKSGKFVGSVRGIRNQTAKG
jgi:hypothetical protein